MKSRFFPKKRFRQRANFFYLAGFFCLCAFLFIFPNSAKNTFQSKLQKSLGAAPALAAKTAKKYPLHKNITSTFFWVGESASEDNNYITNTESAWDDQWRDHFGGTDDPEKRNGFFPADFVPRENPFYVALPYTDFNDGGERKSSARKNVYWAKKKKWGALESMCKNRWVKIQKGDKVAYAQWEDAGPSQYNDVRYVFGKKKPKNRQNNRVGIDVSPAVRDYLGLADLDKVNWKFVGTKAVPNGPWKEIVTSSQIFWP